MINWYLPLYLGVILILYLFPHIASASSPRDYAEGRLGYGGLSTGTDLLLSRLISGDLLGLALLIVIPYGLLGGLGFALAVVVSLFIFIFFVRKLKARQKADGILAALAEQTGRFGYHYHALILLGGNLGNMLLQLAALQYLLDTSLGKSSSLWIILFISVLSLAYAGLGGWDALNKGARPQILLIFLATSVITSSVFLEKGLAATYQEITAVPFHSLGFTKALLLFLTGVIVFSSQYLLDHSLWHAAYRLKSQRQTAILGLTVFCVLAIVLGFSAIAVYGLTQGLGSGLSLISILANNRAVILLNLYVIIILAAVISSYAINLYSAAVIFLHLRSGSGRNSAAIGGTVAGKDPANGSSNSGGNIENDSAGSGSGTKNRSGSGNEGRGLSRIGSVQSAYLFAFILVIILTGAFIFLLKPAFLQLFLILGTLYASLAPSFLHALFRPARREKIADYAGLPTLVLGIGLLLGPGSCGAYYIPLICFASSLLLLALAKLSWQIRKFFIKIR